MSGRLSLRLRVFLFFALVALGSVAIVIGAIWFGQSRAAGGDVSSGIVTGEILAGFLIVGLVLFVWRFFDENLAKPVERIAAEMRARAHAEVSHDLDLASARHLGDLAPAAAAMAERLAATRGALDHTVAEQTARLKRESARLTALLSDVQAGLLVCTAHHQLVFYNTPAVEMLKATGRPRLDRSVFDLLRGGPIRQAYRRLLASEGAKQDAELLVSTAGDGRSLMAHMRLVSGALGLGDTPGYVLTLRDVTADLALHTQRERLISDIVEAVRRPASGLKTLIELRGESGADPEADARIVAEARHLSDVVHEICTLYDATQTTWWPMQEVRAADLVDGMRGHLGVDGPVIDAPRSNLVLRCDGYALVALLSLLAEGIAAETGTRTVSIGFAPEGAGALVRLSWTGPEISINSLEALLARPIEEGAQSATGREVLERHGTDVWPETGPDQRPVLILPISDAREGTPTPPAGTFEERPAVFDFELLEMPPDRSKAGRPVSELTYVVFDTETTGLNPQDGDEIVQIAAVRLLNGRRVDGEVLDMLVDPGRPIPPKASQVHGITNAMVEGAPGIREAGARFHRFAENAVLVAHNAPFDMAFLHRHADAIGAEFDHPIFDTVLLSAILFGQSAEHTLDALAARFGVEIPEKMRHTAYGDALATAEVFQKMLPMLEAKGLVTYDQVLAEMQRNSRLLNEMKARVGAA